MEDIQTIFSEIRGTLQPVEGSLFKHPFLEKVEKKVYSKKQMAVLPKEEYYIVTSDLRSAKYLFERFRDSPSGPFFKNLIETEEFAYQNIIQLAEALDCSKAGLEEHEPDPRCQCYPLCFGWLALHGSEAEVLVAFASNFSVWWSACKRIAIALETLYGVSKEATAFLNPFHDVPPPDTPFDEATNSAIGRDLARGEDGRRLVRIARLIQQYELWFWDALEDLAEKE